MAASKELVVVGSVALDNVETGGQMHADLLGGSASFFATTASHFSKVNLVAVIGEDFPEEHVGFLKSRGVGLEGLERVKGKTFRWTGRYSDDLCHRTTLDTQLNVFADFNPKLPEAWRTTEFLFLGNIHPKLQLSVLEQVKKPRLVAMDTMNLWIDITREDLARVLERVDLIVVNDEEARQLTGIHNLPKAAQAIRKMGPRTVIVKRGDAGALLFHDGGVFAAPAFPLEEVIDPTGAGDSFAGGFMGSIAKDGEISAESVRRAMYYGSVMASFCVEKFSLDRLKTVTSAEIEARYRAFRDLTHFQDVKL